MEEADIAEALLSDDEDDSESLGATDLLRRQEAEQE